LRIHQVNPYPYPYPYPCPRASLWKGRPCGHETGWYRVECRYQTGLRGGGSDDGKPWFEGSGCGGNVRPSVIPPWGTKLGERALNFTLKDQDGRTVSLHDYMGQVIMLDLSAMWCSPCQAEASDAQFLYTTYKDRGFIVLTALIENYSGDAVATDDAKSWAQTYGLSFPVPADEQEKAWDLYDETDYIPLNLIIDKKMVIRYKDTGYDGDVRREVETLMLTLLNQ